ncbi:MAG: ketose-bisphosphate aldolase [Cyanobacteria bacterium QH_9_48_43]|jgi:tagatose 1,6-diphosphate aldolase GatY/KbaY|nr:MAG: ketose-bisphosphate aldolase [Cyanobacteria bacterium QH_10_48_56]PSO74189.1 MAG: ketose-bisphosphate aldolase [Cyanobacteria bacterium QS_1_48_34]PSO79561.1 MAG: ketose-bisphosphate aldolase [Cyanobacteria bacterium QH_9_48_43]PSO82959.1 MAG: ketose-bisphosphate aldolase [Cyanobacteria bacterium QS_5_48_63]PSO91663.1 MAG: ketose-bisphosphate aldolase [Cyanobacteria bacterium QS_3_48_167]PSO93679.1 MAG: ketose-bisphosphate aldolase [Cyanobacteria bacterium QS_6_48_18]PSO94196.1 MAG: k
MLTSTSKLLQVAQRNTYAVGAFNIYNLEGIKAVINAAEAENSPAMLQVHPSSLGYGGSPLIALCLAAASSAAVPVAVQLDHCSDADEIRSALDAGIQSVLADGSHSPIAENLAFTTEMTTLAHSQNAGVEAEVGRISGTEDGLAVAEKEAKMTDPDQARDFVKQAQVDALAVTIGNVHGKYQGEPKLDFDRLSSIRKAVDIPLVLHGASGLPAQMIQQSIQLGVCKFNVNTELRQAYLDFWRTDFPSRTKADVLDCMEATTEAMQAVVAEKLRLFGSTGKASLYEASAETVPTT